MNAFRSIRNKLLALVLLTTFCALAVASAILVLYDLSEYRRLRLDDMRTQMELLAYASVPALQFEDKVVASANLALLRLRPSVQAAAVYDASGQLFASYRRDGFASGFAALPESAGVRTEGSSMLIYSRITESGQMLGTAYISGDYPVKQRILGWLLIITGVMAGAMLVATLMCLWLQTIITTPIRSLADKAREVIDRKEFSMQAQKNSGDEVGVLVDVFNEMMLEINNQTRALRASNSDLAQEISNHRQTRTLILQLNRDLERKVLERTRELEEINKELETFCYSVSHDLRSPLRAISGFSQALREELPAQLPGESARYFDKLVAASSRMGQLIEDLLNLSRVSRSELVRQPLSFSDLAKEVARDIQNMFSARLVELSVWEDIRTEADPRLLRIALENLLGNAWKFTAKQPRPTIEVGAMRDGDCEIFFVKDNGVGFEMKYSDKLFAPFQRLHAANEFPGTGIGLATVKRIINRHGGRIWCDSTLGVSTTFFFTLRHEPPPEARRFLEEELLG